jgi:hypothetical protein
MTDSVKRDAFTLKRWSQRKLAAAKAAEAQPPIATAAPAQAAQEHPAAPMAPATPPVQEAQPLPPVESLTIDSDFTAFLRPDVDETLRRTALRKLFSDPHFNVMDGLDVYIDDYSKPDPLAPAIARSLAQARYLFDPPQTRVTAEGCVEDVPLEENAAHASPRIGEAASAPASAAAASTPARSAPQATAPAPDTDPPSS